MPRDRLSNIEMSDQHSKEISKLKNNVEFSQFMNDQLFNFFNKTYSKIQCGFRMCDNAEYCLIFMIIGITAENT